MDAQTANLIIALASLIVTAIAGIFVPLYIHKHSTERQTKSTKKGRPK